MIIREKEGERRREPPECNGLQKSKLTSSFALNSLERGANETRDSDTETLALVKTKSPKGPEGRVERGERRGADSPEAERP